MANNKMKIGKVPNLRFPGFEGEWEVKKLGEITSKVNSGKTPLGGEAIYTKEGVLFIRSQNVNNDILELKNPVFIPESVNNQMKNSIVQANDILLNITGASLGRSCVVPDDFKIGNVNQHVCIIRVKKQYNSRFLQPIFSSNKGQVIFNSLQTGSGREGLNFESIKGIKLFLPQKDEQQKIASFLLLINNRIATQNKIIEQFETLIKGLSEKLFSQKIRFNEFTDEWELKSLGEVLIKNSTKNKSQKHKIVQSVSNKYGFINQEEMFEERRVASTNTSNYYVIKKGDFAYNPSRINVGSLAYKNDDEISIISPLYISFKANNIFLIDDFLWYWFKIVEFIRQMNNSFEGSVRNTLSYENLTNMNISIPSIKEQTAIAQFLSSIDQKLQTEKDVLEQLEKQKKFLLQNLFV